MAMARATLSLAQVAGQSPVSSLATLCQLRGTLATGSSIHPASASHRCCSTAPGAPNHSESSDTSSSSNNPGASSFEESARYSGHDNQDQQSDEFVDQHDRDRALRGVLRSANAAELAAVHFFRGFSCGPRRRPDADFFAAQEEVAAEGVRQLLPRYRVRPSLAQGPLSLACMALGAVAAAATHRVGLAVTGAVGAALEEHHNEQLRRLNESGSAAQAPDVRQALRTARDLPRVPEGAPPAPDLVSVLQEGLAAATGGGAGAAPSVLAGMAGAVREWGVEGTVGAVVKAGTRVALEAASRL